MALLRYFRPIHNLPDPRGSLSTLIPCDVIREMNRAVEEEENDLGQNSKKRRGPYQKISASERAQIGKYAIQHGATSASKNFSRKLKKPVTRSTAKSIKNDYEEEIRKSRRQITTGGTNTGTGSIEITELPSKKRGRKVLRGENLDLKVQLYLKKVRDGGGGVSSRIALPAARRILRKCNWSMLAKNGGPILLTRYWAHSLLKRMQYVQRKATTSLSKWTSSNFIECKRNFLTDVATTVKWKKFLKSFSSIGTRLGSDWSLLLLGQWKGKVNVVWKWSELMTNDKLLPYFVAMLWEISFQFN
uniref:Uncharacterized protein n=1 Tax=Amphimedon queenslandica TaxID=400682 RepID=A0A1X7V4M5_AMPQE